MVGHQPVSLLKIFCKFYSKSIVLFSLESRRRMWRVDPYGGATLVIFSGFLTISRL